MTSDQLFSVYLRIKPLQDHSRSAVEVLPPSGINEHCSSIRICTTPHSIGGTTNNSSTPIKQYEFDEVFGPKTSHREIFTRVVIPMINDLFPPDCAGKKDNDLSGKSSILFSHSATITDYIFKSDDTITWTIEHLLTKIRDTKKHSVKYGLKMSFLGICNEQIYDLSPIEMEDDLSSVDKMLPLQLRKDKGGRSLLRGLKKHEIKSFAEGTELLSKVNMCQHVSTSSHVVCQFEVSLRTENEDPKPTSFWVVVESTRKKEAPMINLSMKNLLNCLESLKYSREHVLGDKASIVPQRTMLTRLFNDHLTNIIESRIGLIVNINPSIAHFDINEKIISKVAKETRDVESVGADCRNEEINKLKKIFEHKIRNLNEALNREKIEKEELKTKNKELMSQHDELVNNQKEKRRILKSSDELKGACSSTAADLKRKHKSQKEEEHILAQVPDSVRKKFRQRGFAQWNEHILPVLFLGPFDVGQGQVRESWMKMFAKGKRDPRKLCHLVYWFGEHNMSRAFSFVSESKTMTYEDGCKNGYHNLPQNITTKIEQRKTLSYNERLMMKGLDEMNKVPQSHGGDVLPAFLRCVKNNCHTEDVNRDIPTERERSKKSRTVRKVLHHTASLTGEQDVRDHQKLETEKGCVRDAIVKKQNIVGDNVWVLHGVDWKCPYVAKVLSTNEKEEVVEVKYDVCGRKESVSLDRVRLININEGKPSRQRRAKGST